MLSKIIELSIRNKLLVFLGAFAVALLGIYSFTRLPIDAIPDITNNQQQILTGCPTLATSEVEQFVTSPIEQAVKSLPAVVELRSISRFGLSVVTVVFDENADLFRCRQLLSEKQKEAEKNIPTGFGAPEMAPISTGLGEILHYRIEPKAGFEGRFSPADLREVQDWIVKKQLLGTPGVIEVNSFGGLLKQFEIALEPQKLRAFGIGATEILRAVEASNETSGGSYIEKGPSIFFIRADGLARSIEDIRQIVVRNSGGIPLKIGDIADVRLGSAPRFGAVSESGKGETVLGIVMMLKGENAAEVVSRAKKRLLEIEKTLPEGLQITTFLDREKLVNRTISTVQTNLAEGALIVVFVLVLLVGNFRAGLLIASVMPLSMLFAVWMMRIFGVSANLMSLGAIDFGLVVDGAVIIIEAVLHFLNSEYGSQKADFLTAQNSEICIPKSEFDHAVSTSASQIIRSSVFGTAIILIVYLPILTLEGVEGKMFRPMAQTVAFALVGAILLSLTYVPAAAAMFLSKKISHEQTLADRFIEFLKRKYQPILAAALRFPKAIAAFSAAVFAASIWLFSSLGGEFIPILDEGDAMMHGFLRPGTSLEQVLESHRLVQKIILDNFPDEVENVISKIGTAEIPTEPMAIETADNVLLLKEKSGWKKARSKAELIEKIEAKVHDVPGMAFEFTQPIKMRFDEMMTGVRSDLAVKIFGENHDSLARIGRRVEQVLQKIDGLADLKTEQIEGLPQIVVKHDFSKIARLGLLDRSPSHFFSSKKSPKPRRRTSPNTAIRAFGKSTTAARTDPFLPKYQKLKNEDATATKNFQKAEAELRAAETTSNKEEPMDINGKAGRTGSPGETTCSNCHGAAAGGFVDLTSNIPAAGYTAGTTYQMQLTVSEAGRALFGMGLEALNSSNANAGTLVITTPTKTQIKTANGKTNVVHKTNGGASPDAMTFLFNWTAPTSAAVGNVSFYFAGLATNNNGNDDSGDHTYSGSMVVAPVASGPPVSVTTTGTNVTCFGAANGTATANATGGNGTFSYAWSNGQTTQTAMNLSPRTFTVTVTSGLATATATKTITQPSAINLTATAGAGSISCTNSTVSATAAASDGAAGFSYAWSNGASGATVSFNQAGIFTVTATDATGCSKTASVTILGNNTPPTASATGGTLTCAATSVGLTASTNAATATFSWAGPNGFSSTLQNPTAMATGVYSLIRANSANGCTASATATVLENTTQPTASIAAPPALNCNATSVQLNATGSSQGANFLYAWTASGGGQIAAGGSTLTPTVTAAGSYFLSVTNEQNGCSVTASTAVSQLPALSAGISASWNVACFGGSSGSATAFSSGGTGGGYLFSWSNGQNTATATGLAAGIYTVTATDPAGGGCSATASAIILQPAVLAANASATGETSNGANNGTATAQPTGGSPSFTFLWSNGATTATNMGLAPGNFSVTTTDAAGCSATQTVTVNSFSCAVSGSATSSNVSCNGSANGSATAFLTGGTAPIAFLWSNGATTSTISGLGAGAFSVQMTDASGCPSTASVVILEPAVLAANASAMGVTANGATDGTATAQPTGGTPSFTFLWSNGSTNQTITGLATGIFSVTATDSKSCTATQTVTVNAFNCAISASVSAVNATCPNSTDGAASVAVSGGAAPFSFLWSNGATTASITGLAAGNFSVTATDAAGCAQMVSATVLGIDQTAPTIICPPNATACAGVAFEFLDILGSDNCSADLVFTQNSGLPSGSVFLQGTTTQTFSATDAAGNSATCAFTVTVSGEPISLFGTVQNDLGNAGLGAISIQTTGGVGPFSFNWTGPNGFLSLKKDLTDLFAGSYSMTVSGENGCSATATFMVENTVSTEETEAANSVVLFPNPAGAMVFLSQKGQSPMCGDVFDAAGKRVKKLSEKDLLGGAIDLGGLVKGVYFLKMEWKNGAARTLVFEKSE